MDSGTSGGRQNQGNTDFSAGAAVEDANEHTGIGVRRSNRENIGQAPVRYGDWEFGTPATTQQQVTERNNAAASSIGPFQFFQPRYLSTGLDGEARYLSQRGTGVASNAVSKFGEDDDQSVHSRASPASFILEQIKSNEEELKKLEDRVMLKAENISLHNQLLRIQLKEEQEKEDRLRLEDFATYSGGSGASVGSQGAQANKGNYRPTPKPRTKLWKPPEVEPVPAADTQELLPPIYKPRKINFQVGGGAAQQTSPQGVDALAGAIVQALQSQNQQTERFVARQSSSSALPFFSGNPLDWPLFAHHFRQSTEDCGFTPPQNMARLEKALKGEARRTVRSLMIVPTNTEAVMERLEQRYGRAEYIIGALIDIAKRTPTPKESKLSSFLDFSNAIQNLVTTVETLQVPAYRDNPQLLQELVEKLPDSFKIQWGMHTVRMGSGGANLMDFAEWIAEIAEAASVVTIPKFKWKERKEESSFQAAEVVKSDAANKPRLCVSCKKEGHGIPACEDFKKMDLQCKWQFVKKNNLCFRCLRGGHSIKTCKSRSSCKIEGCNRRHHTLLHGNPPDTGQQKDEGKQQSGDRASEINATMDTLTSATLLRIIPVTLHGPKGKMSVNALLDEGSTVTLISRQVADELGYSGHVDPLRIKWTDGRTQEDRSSRKVDCWIGPVGEHEKFKMRKVRTVQNLCLPAQRTDIKEIVKNYPHLQDTKFKIISGKRPVILIGQPHIHLSIARKIIEKDDYSPMLTQTKLGWVLHGPAGGIQEEESAFVCHVESDDDILQNLVKESFALESIGIKASVSVRSKEDQMAEERMDLLTHRTADGTRWETGLLWRNENPNLPYSKDVALRRLISLERKFKRNPDLARQYKEKINHYLEKGYARKLSPEELSAPSTVEWYLPHFDRTHPNKPGKIRIVFDAASRAQGVSLNDYLLTGPDLLVSLAGVLLKLRQFGIALSGDIAEMYHQILIRPQDRPAQRFLWREKENEDPSVYELMVMMFGSSCSPFCAQYVKNKNALQFEKELPKAVEAIIKKHYMDDWLQSFATLEEAIQCALDVIEVHKRGGFEIGKWASNSSKLLEVLGAESKETKNLAEWSDVPTERALGLHWIPAEDMFTFRVNLERAGNGIATGEVIPTKRIVLRLVMLVWDPLGFLGHYIIKARILLQDLWKVKIGWDDEISSAQFRKWKNWILDLPKLSAIRIPRCYSLAASNSNDVSLHVFADSSESASCAVAYLRVLGSNGEYDVSMVMSKTRVAPVKPCSIPRLELTAALIASRLGKFIQQESEIKVHSVHYWTDSMTVIRWIRSEARKFQQFVAVRVGEIQENTEVSQWRWVPSSENPADDGTRDGKADVENTSRWWNGPPFLRLAEDDFPQERKRENVDDSEETLELRKEFVAVTVEVPEFCLPEIERFSQYMRLVRATAYTLMFMDKLRNGDKRSDCLQIRKAEMLLFRRSQWNSYPQEMQLLTNGENVPRNSRLYQLSPVLDNDGVLRMNSRLVTAAEEGIRFPIILHPKDRLTELLISHYHRSFYHAGEDLVRNELRQRFWIPSMRSAVRKVLRDCFVCRKKRAAAHPPVMGALPDVKIQVQPRAFNITGMDYFGPLDVTIGRRHEKRYGVLFTCMNTRAVHLEMAASLTTDSCIMAIRRLIARRGQPSQIFSDNGTNLRGAEKELRKALEELEQERMTGELEAKGIRWQFIPPASAHMGGSWERLVRSVKTAMAVILKCRAPKEEVLQTVFAEAEATVNSRPLVDVPVDPTSPEAITPFHFLIGTSSPIAAAGSFSDSRIELEKQWRQSQALSELFWKRWVREYLPTLQRRAKWHQQRPSIQVGDIVVVLDETLKRNTWPLGLVTQVFPGKDGVVRVAEVRTSSGVYRRPVVKLAKMDLKAEQGDN